MASSTIEWTQLTWNPTTGCNKISAGCKFCYAEIMSKRLQAMGLEKYKDAFQLRLHEEELNRPYSWKKPKVIFVNSMSDLFHKNVPVEFIQKVFKVMNENPQHIFQVLTKRASRLSQIASELSWSHNIWMGVSVESEKTLKRIDYLRKTPAQVKFISCEPLLEDLPSLTLEEINWVIVGGESGKGNIREMKEEWVLGIQEKCEKAGVDFFFKQWGGKNKKKTGRKLKGEEYNDMPSALAA